MATNLEAVKETVLKHWNSGVSLGTLAGIFGATVAEVAAVVGVTGEAVVPEAYKEAEAPVQAPGGDDGA